LRQPPKHFAPVFLHAGWRSASTYVWSRFRRNPAATSFYEPFGEALARCSPKRIQRVTAQGWNSRHPPMLLPYAQEYRPLLRPLLKGVPGYRREFALARYFPTGDGLAPEVRYLSRLIRHAQRRDTHPVLGFSRSLARAAGLKSALGGYHLLLRRNAVQQWLSCRSYRADAALSYFESCHFLILALAPAGSPARRFAATLGLPPLPRELPQQLQALRGELQPLSDELSFRAFMAVRLLSYASAEPAADLVLDIDRLGRSAQYRYAMRTRILADVGLSIDFDDCSVPTHDPERLAIDYAAVERDVRAQLASFGANLAPTPVPVQAVEEARRLIQ
jgi:hypothetical protein